MKATQQDEDKFITKDDLSKYDNNLSLLESYDWLQLVEKPTFSASGNVIDVLLIKSDLLEWFSIDYNVIPNRAFNHLCLDVGGNFDHNMIILSLTPLK